MWGMNNNMQLYEFNEKYPRIVSPNNGILRWKNGKLRFNIYNEN